jgi:hypothetical protein
MIEILAAVADYTHREGDVQVHFRKSLLCYCA